MILNLHFLTSKIAYFNDLQTIAYINQLSVTLNVRICKINTILFSHEIDANQPLAIELEFNDKINIKVRR